MNHDDDTDGNDEMIFMYRASMASLGRPSIVMNPVQIQQLNTNSDRSIRSENEPADHHLPSDNMQVGVPGMSSQDSLPTSTTASPDRTYSTGAAFSYKLRSPNASNEGEGYAEFTGSSMEQQSLDV
jgi:hypothetical protein